MGFVMLLLSVLTLPALMKFFTWTTGTIASSGGGGQLLGAATVGAIAIGAMRTAGGGCGARTGRLPRSRLGPPPGGGGPPAVRQAGAGPAPAGPGGCRAVRRPSPAAAPASWSGRATGGTGPPRRRLRRSRHPAALRVPPQPELARCAGRG